MTELIAKATLKDQTIRFLAIMGNNLYDLLGL